MDSCLTYHLVFAEPLANKCHFGKSNKEVLETPNSACIGKTKNATIGMVNLNWTTSWTVYIKRGSWAYLQIATMWLQEKILQNLLNRIFHWSDWRNPVDISANACKVAHKLMEQIRVQGVHRCRRRRQR